MPKKIGQSTILLMGFTVLMGLFLLAYMGFYNRYWSDDWCYARDFKNLGYQGTLKGYFFTGDDATRGYSTNRFSLTLLWGLLYLSGMIGTQALATLAIVSWLAGLFWVFTNISRLYRPIPGVILFLASAFLLYFVLNYSPQRFQVLYWQAGVHYSATIITGIYLFGFLTRSMVQNNVGKLQNYVIIPLAIFAGGLSETGNIYLVSAFAILFVAIWIGKKKRKNWAGKAFSPTIIILGFLLLAMLVLIVSPSNDRYGTMVTQPANPLFVPFLALKYGGFFIFDSIKSLPLPHIVFISLFASLAILTEVFAPQEKPENNRRNILIILFTGIITLALITVIQAPSAYFYSAPPDPRGQSLSRFTMFIGLAIMAWTTGQIATNKLKLKKNGGIFLAATILIMGTVYTARTIVANYAELPGFVQRAQLWDERDAAIRQAAAKGVTLLDVQVIDTNAIGTKDLMRSVDTGKNNVSNCATEYYGVNAFHAISP